MRLGAVASGMKEAPVLDSRTSSFQPAQFLFSIAGALRNKRK